LRKLLDWKILKAASLCGSPRRLTPQKGRNREDTMKNILTLSIAVALSIAGATLGGAAQAQTKLPELKKQPTPQAVLDEHFAALNACDWDRLLAQYPEDAQINLPNGMIVKGRVAIGALFAGFCKDPKEGGLKGVHFAPENSTTIENTLATQWVATAPFLAEPYRGSDAYITHDGYMQAMVTTFDGGALKKK
jgi:SnoaL-like domain